MQRDKMAPNETDRQGYLEPNLKVWKGQEREVSKKLIGEQTFGTMLITITTKRKKKQKKREGT